MKSTLNPVLFLLLLCGVFGADADEAKSVSGMEGDSVTLNTDPTKIQGFNEILWRFGASGPVIAGTDGKKISYPHLTGRFGDRLQLDHQTGSLTIKNMRINDTGAYKLEISSNSGTSRMTFSVIVSAPGLSPGAKSGIVVVLLLVFVVAAAVFFHYRHIIFSLKLLFDDELSKQESEPSTDVKDEEMIPIKRSKTYEEKIVSVKEGESVTLKTDAEIQSDDQILWMFGPQENLIAESKRETREISKYHGADGRFRDRLELDETTGSLTITNTTAKHIGVYKLQTSSSRGTLNQRFIVTVKITLISIVEGEPFTLYPDTEIQKVNLIAWKFGDEDTLIAQMTGKTRETHEGADGIFRDRLQLDKRTGSLTIKSPRTEHSGLYKLEMSGSRGTTKKIFNVAIYLKKVSAKEGESVTLMTNTVIRRKDELRWLFGYDDTVIAEIKGGIVKISTFDVADGRFKDRLHLDEKTGSLIIRNATTEHAGVYTLKPIISKLTTIERYNVTVRVLTTIGLRGKDVTLYPDTEVQRDDLIMWTFGDQGDLIAQLTGETGETSYDERFKDKLKLNKNTGSLTISNITTGPYKLQIISSTRTSCRKFRVFNSCESSPKTVSMLARECLVLITGFEVERDEKVEWRFEDKILTTGMNGDISKTEDVRFRGRLELDHQTGSLTIKDTRTSDTGVYHLKIGSGENICWEFSVTVSDSRGNRLNNLAIVLMNGEVPVGVNMQQATSPV
ncbi:hypothetical protein R3I93_016930 [Phoxinus phoxinus]|uniref:Immunoglobulin domain-containing protein n=1 Tax=Phoxinus phoxinus TaxID=58324 RepID=A0AAN9GWW6_9TELE